MDQLNVTLNPNDCNGTQTLSNGNLTDSFGTSAATTNIRATHGKTKGKWYWEVKIDSGANTLMIGVASKQYPINSTDYNHSNIKLYYTSSGAKYPGNLSYGSVCAVGDVIGVALDTDNGTLEFYKNGVSMGVSHNDVRLLGEVFPLFKAGSSQALKFTVNFGGSPFAYPIPTGFYAYTLTFTERTLFSKNGSLIFLEQPSTLGIISNYNNVEKNLIDVGMTSEAISLDVVFNKIKKIEQSSKQLGSGQLFEHKVDLSRRRVDKIILI